MPSATSKVTLDCRSPNGTVVARLRLVADEGGAPAPIIVLDEIEAVRLGEAAVQLRESGRYEYALESPGLYRLRCPLARRHLTCRNDEDRGQLDTGSYCGTLRLEIVDALYERVVATVTVEVRSVKLSYREDFRAMLRDLEAQLAGLSADLRAPVQTPYGLVDAVGPAILSLHIALLCERLADPDFQAALQQIVRQPYRQLIRQAQWQSIQQPIRSTRHLARQWTAAARIDVPPQHRLAVRGLASVPASISVPTHIDDVDTPENRFVKHALQEWCAFLQQAAVQLRSAGVDWVHVAERATQAAHQVQRWLNHAMFETVAPMRHLPWNSLVLQRRVGYRWLAKMYAELQRNAVLQWAAVDDLFRAGQRNVALLYEYWVFFQLLDWFGDRFDCREQVAQQLFQATNEGLLLNLRRGYSVVVGATTRVAPTVAPALNAQLRYNQTYPAAAWVDGSWTRTMRPDITLSLWPGGLALDVAAAAGRLTHLHFDAKYRVATLHDVFGNGNGDEDSAGGGAQRDDLLKMHAYRDAIRHSQGAYVIFPGGPLDLIEQASTRRNLMFAGAGLLPSLGAFALVPSADGRAKGMPALAAFLDEVIGRAL